MATGIPPIDAIFTTGRGLMAIPEAVRQEGAAGVFKGFLNPKPYEQSKQARGTRDDLMPEIEAMHAILDNAQDENDLAQAVGQFQTLQGHLMDTGTIRSQEDYDRVLGQTDKKFKTKVRQIGLIPSGEGDGDREQAARAIRLGTITGDEGLTKAGNSLAGVFRSQALTDQTNALMTDRQAQAPDKARKLAAEAKIAEGKAGAAGQPVPAKLGDLDRVRGAIDTQTRDPYTGGPNPNQAPQEASMAEYNRRAAGLGRPPLMFQQGQGVQELTGGAGAVGSRLGAVPGQPPGFAAGPYIPQAQDGAPPPIAALEQQAQIPIPDAFRVRASSPDPAQAVDTAELVEYYLQQGLPQPEAIQAAREAAWELSGAAAQ